MKKHPGWRGHSGLKVRTATGRILQFPQSGAPDSAQEDIRRVMFNRFPFALVYRVDGDEILILAVMHERRRPNYWQDRAGSPEEQASEN